MAHALPGPDWVLVNPAADFQPRDSAGEFVFQDHIWILGGWYTPQVPNPRDVWKSPDGKRWTCVTPEAPWEHSDLSVVLPYHDRMWLMGGRKLPGKENSNKVWCSTDGADWTLVGEAGWSPRVGASFTVFKDRIWVMAGTDNFYEDNEQTLHNDVWTTSDGREWTLEVEHAPWPKRTHAQVTVFDHKLWLMGGGWWCPDTVPMNDVWCSEDGVRWTQVMEHAPWEARMWFSLLVYRGHLWVLGGWNKTHGNFGDVWFSRDGEEWTELKSHVIWKNRHELSSVVFQDRIWVIGGYADTLDSQVWTLELPADWSGNS